MLKDQIDQILHEIDQQEPDHQEAPNHLEGEPFPPGQTIHVYLVDETPEEPPIATIVESTATIQEEPHQQRIRYWEKDSTKTTRGGYQRPSPPPLDETPEESFGESTVRTSEEDAHLDTAASPPSHMLLFQHPRLLLVGVLGCLLALLAGVTWFLLLLPPPVTITIIPDSKVITTTSLVTVVTGPSDLVKRQVQGRLLSTLTLSQAQTVMTTGTGHQDAVSAHGTVTFYNASFVPQTIPAGELLTGASGVQVITDQDAVIPAGNGVSNGWASIPAHALQTGPMGNLAAYDINGMCCRAYVLVKNTTAFTGGQDARSYPVVAQTDIDHAGSLIKTTLEQMTQAAFQAQVHQDETLITPLPCTSKITPDKQAGEEAAQVMVTISETCSGHTYNAQAYQALVAQLLQTEATKHLGDGYTLAGMIQNSITKTTPKEHDQIELQVSISGNYAYQFTSEQQQHLKALIAGKTKAQATDALLHEPGVQSVSISIKNSDTLPTDSAHIQLSFLMTGWSQ